MTLVAPESMHYNSAAMMRTLLQLLFICCFVLSPAAFGEDSNDDWIKPTSATIQQIKKNFGKFKADRGDSEQLSDWLVELTELRGPTQKCVDTNSQELEEITQETEALDQEGGRRGTQTVKTLKDIEQSKSQLKNALVTCKAMLLEIDTLTKKIRDTQQDMLATYLLAQGPNLLQVILDNITQASDWLDTSRSFFKSRLQLHTLNLKSGLFVAGMLLLGIISGRLFRKKLKSIAATLTTHELTTQLSISLCVSFARIMPYLLAAGAVLAGLFVVMEIEPLPPSIALLIAVIAYLLVSTTVGAFLSPGPPAEMFVKLAPAYGSYLNRRLQTLLLIGLLVLLVYVTNLREALAGGQWMVTRSVILLLITLNLIWLISILNRVRGILGNTMLRGLMIVILLASIVAEVIGYRNLSLYLFKGLIGSALLAIALWLANALLVDIFDGLDEGRHRWQQSIRKRLRLKPDESVPGLLWLRLITMFGAWIVFVISVVRLWGYNAAGWTMLAQLITDGFEIGDYKIVPLKLAIAIAVFSLLITFVRWFKQETLPGWVNRSRLSRGAREAVISISGYVGITLAAIFGLSLAGFNFTNIAIVAGALSVGIGFGLQNIVNNFISGIILLFERPIRTGDWIVVGSTEGYVRKISIRSTQIETFDRADVIVPNSELISNQVTNWMLHDPWGRVIISIGVAYGSDVEKVREILLKAANENEIVIKDGMRVTPPKVLFREFGDSSLNFELRCFIRNIDRRLDTSSDLNFAIEKALREANIEIPFPQRDLHIRSVSDGIQVFKGPEK